jgi:hypothetical protein
MKKSTRNKINKRKKEIKEIENIQEKDDKHLKILDELFLSLSKYGKILKEYQNMKKTSNEKKKISEII